MVDINHELQIVQLQLTQEILDSLGITKRIRGGVRGSEAAVSEYARHFRQLFKVIAQPEKNEL